MRWSKRLSRCTVEVREAVSSRLCERTQEQSDSSASELSYVPESRTSWRGRSESGSAAVALAKRAHAAGRRSAYQRRGMKAQLRRVAEGCCRPADAAGLAIL